jgi:hypothetical protein
MIHIGFSLGGFFGILNSSSFALNFCFYPGIICFTESLVKKDYRNTTVFIAGKDNWCNRYYDFSNLCSLPPNKVILENQYHGFMIPNKDKHITIAKYNFPKSIVSEEFFKEIRPHHEDLSNRFGYTSEHTWLKFDKDSKDFCLNYITERIKNL